MPWSRLAASLTLALLVGCGEAPTRRAMPTWFAIGSEHHDIEDARASLRDVLQVGTSPRWFHGIPGDPGAHEPPTTEGTVLEAAIHHEDPAGPPAVILDLRKHLDEIPQTHLGARLTLAVTKPEAGGDLVVHLTLHAGARPLWREIEHRWTQAVPCLVGFYADGKPVQRGFQGAAKFGGVQTFVRLVEPNTSRTWQLRVARASVQRLLGETPPRRVTIVAVFSERQHSDHAAEATRGSVLPDTQDLDVPFTRQVCVRSNLATIEWSTT